ncbi:MAG: hypothetical protein ACP5EQ_07775 [Candidatus Cloacimonadia bacterium]
MKDIIPKFVKPEVISITTTSPGEYKTINIKISKIQNILVDLPKIIELFAGLENLRLELQGDWEPEYGEFYWIIKRNRNNLVSVCTRYNSSGYYYYRIFGKWQKEEYSQKAIEIFGDQIKEVLK